VAAGDSGFSGVATENAGVAVGSSEGGGGRQGTQGWPQGSHCKDVPRHCGGGEGSRE
jgi:hypothetical protein